MEEIKEKENEIQREMSLLEDQQSKASTAISNINSEHDSKQTIANDNLFKNDFANLMTPSHFNLSSSKLQTSSPYNYEQKLEQSTEVEGYEASSSANRIETKLYTPDVSEPVERKDLEQLLKQQQEAMSLMASSLRIGFEMPKRNC